jgi:organic hydroperoxide reductase OsmC/OhrA
MKEYFYEVDLSWNSGKSGTLTSFGLDKIEVVFSLESLTDLKHNWAPEHLLAAFVSTCFMTAFLALAEIADLDIKAYKSQCFLKLERIDTKFITTEILLRPVIVLANNLSTMIAFKCTEEAEQVFALENILKIPVGVHPHFEFTANGESK